MPSDASQQPVPPDEFRVCIVIPFYNHAGSIAQVIHELRPLALERGLRCYLVNDGSDASCEPVLSELARSEATWLRVINYQPNQGKGMAVMTGLDVAARDGFTHAAQIDADGQHRVEDVKTLLQMAQQHPRAMITGYAVYDASVPRSRLYGRYATHVWVWINTLSLQIRDSMCGLRVYPLAPTLAIWRSASNAVIGRIGKRMSFDIEILVHLYWRGVRIINVPVPVTYPLDGVSHFKVWRDNVQISAAHTRMFFGMLWRAPMLLLRSLLRDSSGNSI
ncbi:MAG: glycosyltransferase family 2 protein [Steroidobacteraceae bacterium]